MRGRRLGSLALAALVVASALGAFAPAASAATGSGDAAAAVSTGSYITVGNVTVEPDDPVVGEQTTITATFDLPATTARQRQSITVRIVDNGTVLTGERGVITTESAGE
mgnify:CR=1 FL=1